MNNQKVDPQKVTKPIQLLAAWLVGLIVVNGSFLSSAVALGVEAWESSVLVIAAVFNVPMFLGAIFLLQTRFRPELQEDAFYSQYLDKKSNQIVTVKKDESQDSNALKDEIKRLENLLKVSAQNQSISWGRWAVALNKLMPDYSEIRKALRAGGIRLESIFGTNDDSELPESTVVALNEHMDAHSVIKILGLLVDFKIDGYAYFEPVPEIDTEDVYIGAYGYNRSSTGVYPINDELKQLLSDVCEEADLREFERLNK
ncbi:hypothetical protein GKA54_14240 [Vibrio parahaemolyticus]|uniref:hypothetical protein n=1 Tax=Vibrio parahaemolyticus TaxID=670 RepID=UPI00061B5A61|nr:hypothetical protein [Vibrio parahaemolyticus]EGQ8146218.1 hypothetical protein [Vibrio parahaemolyticus]EGQ8340108.1 hypothetical protein [Vibrio parahaemolyticus]EGQ8372847.1 hypothetical protein [Vibrio parahaemolyticus]EGQ8725096.1 hypothetical protein [Vibrio parahaemolyticus]EGQ8764421.1 hypothetical protein [Vibrio parahaemolyticus]